MIAPGIRLNEIARSPGRAIYVERDGTLYLSRGYSIHRSNDDGRTWAKQVEIPCSFGRRVACRSRLASRLLRHEVRAFATLADGTLIAATRQGVYYAAPGDAEMTSSRIEGGAAQVYPPMMLTAGPANQVLWGEYNSKTAHGNPVRLFVSIDRGRSFTIARVFEGGSILHIHNLIYDPPRECYWVLAGDHHHEPGIGRLTLDFQRFEWVGKGEQRYRAVDAFDFGNRLIYATDSEREQNYLIGFDKATGRTERIREFDGSCIYATRFGEYYALTTTVEPSKVNRSRHSRLWLSRDGEHWVELLAAEKDRWNPIYFQFGSIVLPRGCSERSTLFFSGQAVKGWDGVAATATVQFE